MDNDKARRHIDIIVEARMTSSRLPGKVMKKVLGKPMLQLLVERLRRVRNVNKIIIATTANETDDIIVGLADDLGISSFKGHEEDVLGRVVQAAKAHNTEIIVQMTGDNPLVAPEISSMVIEAFLDRERSIDFAANDLELTFPLGFATRVFSRKMLERVERSTNHPVDREHVVNYIVKRPHEFRLLNVPAKGIYRQKAMRFTMDTPEDFFVVKLIFESLYPKKPDFDGRDIITYLNQNPHVRDFNSNIIQRTYEYD